MDKEKILLIRALQILHTRFYSSIKNKHCMEINKKKKVIEIIITAIVSIASTLFGVSIL